MIYHCLFEQSGTFKNVFKEFGHQAYDYDILNDYGETDYQIDLFHEIDKAYGKLTDYTIGFDGIKRYSKCEDYYNSIFDNMKPSKDFIIAFFPCTYFSAQQELNFRLQNSKLKKEIKINNGKFTFRQINFLLDMTKNRELFFSTFIKFCYICDFLGISTIIENPANISKRSYLELYSPYRPTFYEKDRSLFGDIFIKPTMFISINFDMKENFEMFYDKNYNIKLNNKVASSKRSLITSTYAKNFYKRFLSDTKKVA